MEVTDYVVNIGDDEEPIMAVIEKYMTNQGEISDTEFQKAKRLLNSFKHVLWTMDEECRATMNEDLAYAVGILDKFDYHMDTDKIERKLIANQETSLMANLIITAIFKVKEYPTLGESYYNVLQKTYLSKEESKEMDILYDLDISRSTFYKYKKDAVKIFGYCLWQTIIPNMKKERSTRSGQVLSVVGFVG